MSSLLSEAISVLYTSLCQLCSTIGGRSQKVSDLQYLRRVICSALSVHVSHNPIWFRRLLRTVFLRVSGGQEISAVWQDILQIAVKQHRRFENILCEGITIALWQHFSNGWWRFCLILIDTLRSWRSPPQVCLCVHRCDMWWTPEANDLPKYRNGPWSLNVGTWSARTAKILQASYTVQRKANWPSLIKPIQRKTEMKTRGTFLLKTQRVCSWFRTDSPTGIVPNPARRRVPPRLGPRLGVCTTNVGKASQMLSGANRTLTARRTCSVCVGFSLDSGCHPWWSNSTPITLDLARCRLSVPAVAVSTVLCLHVGSCCDLKRNTVVRSWTNVSSLLRC